MNRFFTLLLAASCLTAVGQVTYPYNPDGNADALIGVTDLQDMLSVYGGVFLPSEILVGDSTLSFWVDQLSETVLTQQATIDNLVDQLAQLQSDVWYQSWHPSVRATAETAANQQLLTYYHGFIAPKTGMLTHMKVRVRNSFGSPEPTLIRAGVYKSDVNASIPKPIGLLTEGQIFTTVTEHQIIDVAFDLPVEVEKGNVYFAALQQDSPFGGCNFYGSDAPGAGNLAWKEISPSGSFLPLVSEGDIIQDVQAAFWFIVD